jgi:acyl carrier protein
MITNDGISVQIKDAVVELLSNTLRLNSEDIELTSRLSADFGADSIDMLDILHGLEKKLGIVIELADFGKYFRGDLTEDEFRDESGVITEKGLAQLATMFPQAKNIRQGMNVRHVFELLNVEDLINFINAVKVQKAS